MKLKTLRKILTVVSFLLAGILLTGTVIGNENAPIISQTLGAKTFEVVNTGNANEDTEYYKSSYKKIGDLVDAGYQKAVQVLGEGSVLLKNDNNALPLSKGSKVSLVGVTAYDPVYGGTGSGGISTEETKSFVEALELAGLELNPTLKDSYTSEEWKQYKRGSEGRFGNTVVKMNGAPWDVVDAAAGSTFAQYGDAAILFVGRVGGEGYDLSRKGGDGVDNGDGLGPDYLGLNARELSVLEGLKAKKAAGEIKKIIVIINYSSMIEGDFLADPAVDAAMWIGAPGIGTEAVGLLLTGDINPSGRLPDTMWVDNAMNPVNVNFGRFGYEGAAELGVTTELGTGIYPANTLSSYVVYQEGMYLGYRYTETRYEDLVLGTPKVGAYNYNDVVARPFGFGLSYADFELSNVNVTKEGDRNYKVTVTVKNTSDTYAGKHSVPVWVSKPYGDYARKNQIQVPSVELVNFGKTKILNPGESQTLTITLDERYFTSYDANNAKTYVLMDGDYYVAVGGSAHDAVNNVLSAKKQNGVKIDESKMIGSGDASLVKKFTLSFDKEKYSVSDAVSMIDGVTKAQITNLFDFADINKYEGRGNNHVDYYSRDNWEAVSLDQENGFVKLTMTEQMAREIYAQVPEQTGKYNNAPAVPAQYQQPIQKDNGEYPAMGVPAGLNLIDMRYDSEGNEISFFDPIWDTFMDQLTWKDLVTLCGSGGHTTMACDTVAKPATRDENGPNGFNVRNGGFYGNQRGLAYRTEMALGHVNGENLAPSSYGGQASDAEKEAQEKARQSVDQAGFRKPTGFPANGILAATFNQELAHEVGNIIGEDGIWLGFSGLYGIGLNTHRSPYSGRTCEYFSEDGMLAGLMGAAESLGIEEKGVHVYNKHCALNDQEANRHGICTWATEQSIREIYLRAFELPIIMGGAFNTMNSFNRIGLQTGAACPALSESFLRGECGMKGIIVTDAYGDMDGSQNCDPYFEQVYSVLVGGSDIPDGGTPLSAGHFDKYETGYSAMAWAMRKAAKRVMYQTVWSNAMNGISSTTKIVSITPWWQMLLNVLDIVFCVLLAGCLVWTVIDLVNENKKKKKA